MNKDIRISFIVCTYNIEFFNDTVECINSLVNLDYQNKEIVLVMDKNEQLYEILINTIPKSVKIKINTIPGLSEARNIGIYNATGEIIVFIDDDATVDQNYIQNLIKNYEEQNVIGVFGKIFPKGKPNYPEELYWIGGFTNKGFPEERTIVRNGYGCNMSFKKEIFDKVGLFDCKFGRVGKDLKTCEETVFSIKALNLLPQSKIMYDPSVIVYHKVHEYRQTFRYMIKRAYHEGISKANINKIYGSKNKDDLNIKNKDDLNIKNKDDLNIKNKDDLNIKNKDDLNIKNIKNKDETLSTEDKYLKYLLSKALPARVFNIFTGNNVIRNTTDIIIFTTVIAAVGIGYTYGKYFGG